MAHILRTKKCSFMLQRVNYNKTGSCKWSFPVLLKYLTETASLWLPIDLLSWCVLFSQTRSRDTCNTLENWCFFQISFYSQAYVHIIYEKTKAQVPLGPLLGKQNIQAKEFYYHTMVCRYILTTDHYEKKKIAISPKRQPCIIVTTNTTMMM